eukprot:CAMPEP_0184986312 /NCGR_PEP_ID=MMETSP1098-20130426/16092_1 /TAXON_ID=89044 /ORGANISM="Spumella elongata, Strain CCAP 955/1" /LENGTH=572 /DNA_ID=CAMNT_0027510525 /DNA_START=42 /DNA_END=1760 /DNA_ORIENTATION=+
MKLLLWSALAQTLILMVQSSRLMDETMQTYRRVLADIKGSDSEIVTVADLKRLIELHDDDAFCGDWCQKYLTGLFAEYSSTAGHNLQDGMPWPIFNEIADKIYGDAISDDPFQPQEIHLSLTGDATEMKVMWITMDALVEPYVEYRAAAEDSATTEWTKASARNFTYVVPQNWWPTFTGVIYMSTMTKLAPDVQYTYRMKGFDTANQTERSSADFQFKAAPVNAPDRTTKIATLADQGTFMLLGVAVQEKLGQLQDSLGIDIATVVGDLSYAGLSSALPRLNISKEDEFEHMWDLYGIQSQPVAATRPWMVTNGNHERFYDYAAFRNRYSMPAEKSGGSLDNFWYSYDYGNVHWVSISSEHDLDDGSVQKEWLRQNLAAAAAPERRAQFPWIVVALHKPLYCSADGWGTSYADLLETLLIQYNVDLTITGHMHIYERIHPTLQGGVTCYPQRKRTVTGGKVHYVDTYKNCGTGPVHVVQGNTGGMQAETFTQPAPAWSAVRFANGFLTPNRTTEATSTLLGTLPETLGREHWNYTNTFGFGVVTFVNATHLQYNAVPITGDIGVDDFWIVKH